MVDLISPRPEQLPAGLRRLCLLVRAMVATGALALLLVLPWSWSSVERVEATWMQAVSLGLQKVTLDERALWLGGLTSLLPLTASLATLWQLWQLWRLFGEYGAGRVFGRDALRYLKRFATGVLVLAGIAPLIRTLYALVLTLGNPPGERMLVVKFSSDDYAMLLLAAVLFAIASVMEQAVKVAEDHAGFV